MKTIAVIGTGIMGAGIASNFLEKSYSVVIWNRSSDRAAGLIQKGAILANSAKDAIEKADIVFEVTANDESSREVWTGENGILAGARADQVLITSATLSLDWVTKLSELCAERGFTFFDMPMTGGRIAAESGNLTFLVGGNPQALEEFKPDLEAVASKVLYFGEAGSGTKFKLILNALQAIHIAGFGEALRMANEVGLDIKTVGEALADRPGGVITNLAWRDYQQPPDPINFSIEWIAKDLEYAKKMSSLDTPLLDDVLEKYQKYRDDGGAQMDWTNINKDSDG